MDIKKCKTCKWLVLMSFCDGKTVDPSRQMCHYNWKECAKVRPDEGRAYDLGVKLAAETAGCTEDMTIIPCIH